MWELWTEQEKRVKMLSIEKDKWVKKLEKAMEAGKSGKALTTINEALDRVEEDI